jgi:hypothetical protein
MLKEVKMPPALGLAVMHRAARPVALQTQRPVNISMSRIPRGYGAHALNPPESARDRFKRGRPHAVAIVGSRRVRHFNYAGAGAAPA